MAGQHPAWDAVHEAAERSGVTVVSLVGLADAERVRSVIEQVWGEQVVPRELIRAFQHAGSTLYGAEAGGDLVGFVLGFIGYDGGIHLHSHMLGVVPGWQVRGVGYTLKLAQRAGCLEHGIGEARWTYDPLVARNARFNLVKLGAVAFRFLPEFYGEMTDRLNRGDRSDRFEVRWVLESDHVRRALSGEAEEPEPGDPLLIAEDDEEGPEPRPTAYGPGPGCTVAIPRDHQGLRSSDPVLAMRWRETTREAFIAAFGRGLEATWFTREGTYVFTAPAER